MKRLLTLTLGATLAAFAILEGPTLVAQMQQSGGPGSSVTLLAGSAKVGIVTTDQTTHGTTDLIAADLTKIAGTAIATGNGTAGAGTHRVTIASDNTAFTVNAAQSGTWTVQPGNTANTTPWFVKSVPASTCGTTAVSQALVAVPTSSTAVFASTTCLFTVFFQNSNASAQTVTLTDNAGTPLNAVGPAFSIPGLSNMVIPLGGIPFSSGVKWVAGGTGVLGGMAGFQ